MAAAQVDLGDVTMISLIAALLWASPMPEIAVAKEGDIHRLTVGQFSWSQGEAVNELIDKTMTKTCGTKAIKDFEFDFKSVDPDNHLSDGPPIERQVWDYWATFQCVDPKSPPSSR